MENDKNLENQADALKEEDLESVAGGMLTQSSVQYGVCPSCKAGGIVLMETALGARWHCPHCGTDSLKPDNDYRTIVVSTEFLKGGK